MSERINEKVSVVSVYNCVAGSVSPRKIRWQGRDYLVMRVGFHYPVRRGRNLFHFFSVMTQSGVSFKLRHDTETLHWVLEEVVDEFNAQS